MDPEKIEKILNRDPIASLDVSMFDDNDIMNVILQRSRVLYDVPRSGRVIRSWVGGKNEPIEAVVASKGLDIVRRALAIMYLEFLELEPRLKKFNTNRVADIGCGYGFIDLFMWRSLGSELLLIDIEESENRNFGFKSQGAAYSDLDKAKAFLMSNGVPETAIATINPNNSDLMETANVDVAISLLSCGFHYPLSSYSDYFSRKLKSGGAVIVDIRENNKPEQQVAINAVGKITDQYFHVQGTNRTIITKR